MIKEYEGKLGKFKYDNTEFELIEEEIKRWSGATCGIRRTLKYIGKEIDGSKIKIPEGITDCNDMFSGNRSLKTPPIIPDGVTDCNNMFCECHSLMVAPVIPKGIIDCSYMFDRCWNLEKAPEIPDGVKYCNGMFWDSGVTEPSEIPDSVIDVDQMYDGCDLKWYPSIPKGAERTTCEVFGDETSYFLHIRESA